MVFVLATLCVALSISAVSAGEITNNARVTVDGALAGYVNSTDQYSATYMPSVIAGDTVNVKVTFVALADDTDVTFEAELEGQKDQTRVVSKPFDVEANKVYSQVLTLKVPFELRENVSDELTLSVELDGNKDKTIISNLPVNVQRPSYNAQIKSISVPQTVSAGAQIPVDVVIKNMGYNDLNDLYVTAKIADLGLSRNAYFGDLANIESCTNNCDEEDTASGRIYLDVPYGVKAGTYDVIVTVKNDDEVSSMKKQVVISNDFDNLVIVPSDQKTVAAGEDAEYELILVNPTNKLVVYRIVPESSKEISSSVSEAVVAVPAGSSESVKVIANAAEEGKYTFDVSVFSGENSVGKATLNANVEGSKKQGTDPIVVLTVVLAVIFIVLLVVLIVLLGKKPKTEDFGESYY